MLPELFIPPIIYAMGGRIPIRDAKPRGTLFNAGDNSGAISCVFSNFFVDHLEPLEALSVMREYMNWPLGDLHDGHEFLLLLEARRRARSTSRPKWAA